MFSRVDSIINFLHPDISVCFLSHLQIFQIPLNKNNKLSVSLPTLGHNYELISWHAYWFKQSMANIDFLTEYEYIHIQISSIRRPVFEYPVFGDQYSNIQYSETSIRISEYIWIFALYWRQLLIEYEYEYIQLIECATQQCSEKKNLRPGCGNRQRVSAY